jgi:hypothetical protein
VFSDLPIPYRRCRLHSEIFNPDELHARLESNGHRFQPRSYT